MCNVNGNLNEWLLVYLWYIIISVLLAVSCTLYLHNHVVFKLIIIVCTCLLCQQLWICVCKNHMHLLRFLHAYAWYNQNWWMQPIIYWSSSIPTMFCNVNYVTGLACGRHEYTWDHIHLAQHVSFNKMSYVNYRYLVIIPQLIYTNHLFHLTANMFLTRIYPFG